MTTIKAGPSAATLNHLTTEVIMPKLIIDEREIEVPQGTKVIEAAERLGIMIPRFCYHPALGSVGACRVCAVKCLQGPFKGVQMSCMMDAQDGMVISTTDPEAVEFRRFVIEWLMLHHPHDCPVCDEGGHCLLQDMTISGGHGRRRYEGNKRTYPDQDLGPLVQHEMNRCIHCYRCSRFYQEFTGYRDLGAMQIANRTYFGRFAPGVLESPFAGNLSDLCPTGVYTDKPSRYKGRRWDFERQPGICINCSLGCHTVVSSHYREIVRQEARFSPVVNGYFICDRGRFGFYYAEDDRRPRQARVDGQPAAPEDGRRHAADRLDAVAADGGPGAVACLGGLRSSLETQSALHRLCRGRGWRGPSFFTCSDTGRRTAAAAECLAPDLAVSLRDIEQADAVVVVGTDPINEAPMLALALRQAQRRGAAVTVIDPRPVEMPLAFTCMALPPEHLGPALGLLCREGVGAEAADSLGFGDPEFHQTLDESRPALEETLTAAAAHLHASRRPVIVCGTDLPADGLPELAANASRLLSAAGKSAGLFYVMAGAGAFGAALLNQSALEDTLAGIENGEVRALLVVENDLNRYADRARLEKALARLELLVVIDYLDSDLARQAHILLPAATVYESGGSFANQEGRLQQSPAVSRGGLSIRQIAAGGHPPRAYAAGIPGYGLPPTWQTLASLEGRLDAADARAPLAHLAQTVTGLPPLAAPKDTTGATRRLIREAAKAHRFESRPLRRDTPPDGLRLLLTDWTFGTEPLSLRSACLEKVTPAPCICLHPDDAGPLGLCDGDKAVITTRAGRLTVGVRVVAHMAAGVLVLPRHGRLDWRIFPCQGAVIAREHITPAGGPAGTTGG